MVDPLPPTKPAPLVKTSPGQAAKAPTKKILLMRGVALWLSKLQLQGSATSQPPKRSAMSGSCLHSSSICLTVSGCKSRIMLATDASWSWSGVLGIPLDQTVTLYTPVGGSLGGSDQAASKGDRMSVAGLEGTASGLTGVARPGRTVACALATTGRVHFLRRRAKTAPNNRLARKTEESKNKGGGGGVHTVPCLYAIEPL